MDITGIVAVLSLFVGAPAIVFGFIYLSRKQRVDLELAQRKKEILELEVKKAELHLKELAEENRKYDRIIDGSGGNGQ